MQSSCFGIEKCSRSVNLPNSLRPTTHLCEIGSEICLYGQHTSSYMDGGACVHTVVSGIHRSDGRLQCGPSTRTSLYDKACLAFVSFRQAHSCLICLPAERFTAPCLFVGSCQTLAPPRPQFLSDTVHFHFTALCQPLTFPKINNKLMRFISLPITHTHFAHRHHLSPFAFVL